MAAVPWKANEGRSLNAPAPDLHWKEDRPEELDYDRDQCGEYRNHEVQNEEALYQRNRLQTT